MKEIVDFKIMTREELFTENKKLKVKIKELEEVIEDIGCDYCESRAKGICPYCRMKHAGNC
jgi:hypothetical protein